jgi:hypothetical protein
VNQDLMKLNENLLSTEQQMKDSQQQSQAQEAWAVADA